MKQVLPKFLSGLGTEISHLVLEVPEVRDKFSLFFEEAFVFEHFL